FGVLAGLVQSRQKDRHKQCNNTNYNQKLDEGETSTPIYAWHRVLLRVLSETDHGDIKIAGRHPQLFDVLCQGMYRCARPKGIGASPDFSAMMPAAHDKAFRALRRSSGTL